MSLVEAWLQHERGYLGVFTLRGDKVKADKHLYAAKLLESLRKDLEEFEDEKVDAG